MTARPRCVARRRDGEPCRSFAVRDGLCSAHSKSPEEWRELSSRGGKFSTRLRELRRSLAREREEEPEEVDDVLVDFQLRQEEATTPEPEPSGPKLDPKMELLRFQLQHDLLREEDLPEKLAAQLEAYLVAQIAAAETSLATEAP
jgi:hypothetical protein